MHGEKRSPLTDITDQLSLWIQQLKAIAQTGLAFNSPHAPSEIPYRIFDRERYESLLKLAATMAATVNSGATVDPALADSFAARWRADVVKGVPGYVTPKVGIGAVVFNDRDEMLLIKRPEGGWFYPTGWGDVGLSPAQVAVKEVLEETGLVVSPLRVIGIYDSSKWRSDLNPHFYSIVFECRLESGTLHPHPLEALDAGFYPRTSLPEPIYFDRRQQLDEAWARHCGEVADPFFDRP